MIRKQFILVAGVDFVNFTIDFGDLCITRALELHEKYYKQADLLFTIFDFAKGTISQMKASGESGAISAPKIIKTFRPVKTSDYTVVKLGTGLNSVNKRLIGTLSAPDIYNAVIEIGVNNPGELIELSFFTAFTNSFAILVVNTFLPKPKSKAEKAAEKDGIRLPGDLDPYPYRDFDSPRMDEIMKGNFQTAFSKTEGNIRVWAGDRDAAANPKIFGRNFALFKEMQSNPAFKSTELPEDTIFIFPRLPQNLYEDLKEEIEYEQNTTPDRINTRVPLGVLKYMMYFDWRSMAHQLCMATGIKTYGPVEPAIVDFEKGKSFNLMQVSEKYKEYVQFFEDQFGFKHEPDRFYTEYNPDDDYDEVYFDEEIFHAPKPQVTTSPAIPQPPATIPSSVPVVPQPSTKPVAPPVSQPASAPTSSQPTSQPTRQNIIEQKEYVFVCGVDYKFNRKEKINFRKMAMNRMTQIIADSPKNSRLNFTLFDFASGRIISHSVNENGEGKTTVQKTLGAVSLSDYKTEVDENGEQVGFFQEKKNKLMGMDDAFDHIIEIGKSSPGTLFEFSIFSHGTEFRPRTLHFIPDPPFTENPDPGTWKFYDPFIPFDFSSVMMSKSDSKFLADAFHKDGYSWCWGCETSLDLQKFMRSLLESREYKAGISLDTIIKLKPDIPFFRRMVNALTGVDPGIRKVKSPFGFLIRVITVQLTSSYMYHLAKATNKPVYGGLPGVMATTEKGSSGNLIHIDQSAFKKFNQFFKDNFQFGFDDEKRGYGKYLPTNKWDLKDYPGTEFDSFFTEEITEKANS